MYPRIGTKYGWGSTFYCCPWGLNTGAIPVNQFCKENHVTRTQVRRMLITRELFGLKSQGKFYVCKNPDYE